MHKIKRQAKYSAWYDSPNDETNVPIRNPFSKWKPSSSSNTRLDSEEAGPSLNFTRTDSPDNIEHIPSHAKSSIDVEKSHPKITFSDNYTNDAPSHKDDDANDGKIKPRFTAWSQIRATLLNSWINVLFLLVPAGFALNYTNVSAAAVFTVNFVALIPSTVMISFAVEEIMLRTGDIWQGLLSNTFSNATQLISSILLLKNNQITILKTSLLGTIISNLLLMTGLCFFFGGLNRIEQAFSVIVAQTTCMMLLLAIVSLVVPTASRFMVAGVTNHDIVIQSRGTSIIILMSYALYLLFQLKTNRSQYDEPSKKNEKRPIVPTFSHAVIPNRLRSKRASAPQSIATAEDEPEEPQLALWVAVLTLVLSTVLVAFNAEFATGSVQQMVHEAGISQTFVGFVIFPILSNDPDSIIVAIKDKMQLSISLTLDKCIQTALLVVPLLVIIAWAMSNDDMTLDFEAFPVAITFASIIVVAYIVQEGRSNWLMGALLIKIYAIVALATYFVP